MKLDYICKSEYHPSDEFTLFAKIFEKKNGIVKFNRFMNFGKIECGVVEMEEAKFEHFYRPCEPDESIEVDL